MTRLYSGCAFFMMTSITMVLLILVETTWPILVARRLCFVGVSAIYLFLAWLVAVFVFFLFWALAFALAAGLVFAACSVLATTGSVASPPPRSGFSTACNHCTM